EREPPADDDEHVRRYAPARRRAESGALLEYLRGERALQHGYSLLVIGQNSGHIELTWQRISCHHRPSLKARRGLVVTRVTVTCSAPSGCTEIATRPTRRSSMNNGGVWSGTGMSGPPTNPWNPQGRRSSDRSRFTSRPGLSVSRLTPGL